MLFNPARSQRKACPKGGWSQILPNSLPRVLTALLALGALTPATALAQTPGDAPRISEIERKLDTTLDSVRTLQNDLERLRRENEELRRSRAADTGGATAPAGSEDLKKSVDAVNERLNDVEDTVVGIEEKVGSRALVKGFDAVSLDVGGFLHTVFTHVEGEDGSASSFNRQVFELLIKAEMWEDWTAFIAQAFIRESDVVYTDPEGRRVPDFNIASKTPTVIAWANYRYSDALNIQLGRYITPHGIVNIEHFPALLLDPEQPQFLRPFSGQTIFANFLEGANIHGRFFNGADIIQYSAYVGNFTGNATDLDYGARASYTFGGSGITVGLNGAGGQRLKTQNSDYQLYGVDLFFDKGLFIWKNEFYQTFEQLGDDRLAYYTQPGIRLTDQWTAFYRYDFLDNGGTAGDQVENAFGLSFKPNPAVHLRAITRLQEIDDGLGVSGADTQQYQFLATFSF